MRARVTCLCLGYPKFFVEIQAEDPRDNKVLGDTRKGLAPVSHRLGLGPRSRRRSAVGRHFSTISGPPCCAVRLVVLFQFSSMVGKDG